MCEASRSPWRVGLQFTAAELAREEHGRITGPGVTKGGPACWWSPRGVPCEDFWAATRGAGGRAVPYEHDIQSTLAQDGHDTGSADVWRRFYTQAVGDTVWRLYRSDFAAFRYAREIFDQPRDGTASAGDEYERRKRSAFGALSSDPAEPPDDTAGAPPELPLVEPVLVSGSARDEDWAVVGAEIASEGSGADTAQPRGDANGTAAAMDMQARREQGGKRRGGEQAASVGKVRKAAGKLKFKPRPQRPHIGSEEAQALADLQRLAHAP